MSLHEDLDPPGSSGPTLGEPINAGDLIENEAPLALGTPVFKERDPGKDRFTLTTAILVITSVFTVAVAWILVAVDGDVWERLQSQLGFLLTPFHTLLGIAIGYYFADKSREKD